MIKKNFKKKSKRKKKRKNFNLDNSIKSSNNEILEEKNDI